MPKTTLNIIDRKILTALQENARISNVDLANRVGLSPSPCLRRVKQLEENGLIRQYVALLDQRALHLPLTVMVSVSLISHDPSLEDVFLDYYRDERESS